MTTDKQRQSEVNNAKEATGKQQTTTEAPKAPETNEQINEIIGAPIGYLNLLRDFKSPENFLNIEKAAEDLRKSDNAILQEALSTTGGDLDKALIKLRLPFIPDEKAELIVNSPSFKQIRKLLILLEHKLLKRLKGVIGHLEAATDFFYYEEERQDFVQERTYQGSVIRVDVKGFTGETHEKGEAAMSQHYEINLFKPTFYILRRFPNIRLSKTIGDELIFTCSNLEGDEDIEFAEALAHHLGVEAHFGIARGEFKITRSRYGKTTINGDATEAALHAQKISKEKEGMAIQGVIPDLHIKKPDGKTTIHPPIKRPLPEIPNQPALHLFKNIKEEILKQWVNYITEYNTDKFLEQLETEIRKQLALISCTEPRAVIELEKPVERKAMALCVRVPRTDETKNDWEEELMKFAEKYDGTVVHFELNTNPKEKMGLITFGALGSSPFNQEDRTANFTNEFRKTHQNSIIGVASGDVHVSDTSKTGTFSDALNRAVKLAFSGEKNRQERGEERTKELGPVRIGPQATQRFTKRRIPVKQGDFAVTEFKIRRLPTIQETTTCENFGQTQEDRYVRMEIVNELVTTIQKHPGIRINIAGEQGMGKERILKEVAKQLNGVAMPAYHEKHKSYAGIEKIMQTLFPTSEDFDVWMERHQITDAKKDTWCSLLKELLDQDNATTNILQNAAIAKQELIEILDKIENLVIACPNLLSIDDDSLDIIKGSATTIISTGPKNGAQEYKIEGVKLEETMAIVAHQLGVDATELPETLKDYLGEKLPRTVQGYNPFIVEKLVEDLIEAKALTPDKTTFKAHKATETRSYTSVEEFTEGIVESKLEEIAGDHIGKTILKYLIIIGECTVKQLAIGALGNPQKTEFTRGILLRLEEKEIIIIDEENNIRFAHPFFAGKALEKAGMQLESEEHLHLEKHTRTLGVQKGSLPIPHYLKICERTKRQSQSEVIGLIATETKKLLDQAHVITTINICEQYIGMLDTRPQALQRFKPQDAANLIRIHLTLIEAKTIVGKNVEGDIQTLGRLLINIQQAIVANSAASNIENTLGIKVSDISQGQRMLTQSPPIDAEGGILIAGCEAAFKSKDTRRLETLTAALRIHLDSHKDDKVMAAHLTLNEARINFRRADIKSLDITERRKAINETIRSLAEVETEAISAHPRLVSGIQSLQYQARGYRISEPQLMEAGDEKTAETTRYLAELKSFLEEKDETDGAKAWFLEVRLYQARPMVGAAIGSVFQGADNAEENFAKPYKIVKDNIEKAIQNGYFSTTMRSLNYILNVILYGSEVFYPVDSPTQESKTYDPARALKSLEEAEDWYLEATKILEGISPEDEKGIAEMILMNQVTRLECINKQLKIIQANPLITGQDRVRILQDRGIETIRLIESFYSKHTTNPDSPVSQTLINRRKDAIDPPILDFCNITGIAPERISNIRTAA